MYIRIPLLGFGEDGDIHFIRSDDHSTRTQHHCLLFRHTLHQISLLLTVIIYLILGGLFFEYIESQYYLKNDDVRKEIIHETYENIRVYAVYLLNEQLNENFENAYYQWRWQSNRSMNYIYLNNERANLLDNRTTIEIEQMSLRLSMQHVSVEKFVYKWTYSTAILYAATLVTTIGYGNISPKTARGKIFTVICKLMSLIAILVILFSFLFIRCISRYLISCIMDKISWRIFSNSCNKILSTFKTMFTTYEK
ncbi:hypothetical protein I4U23_008929 [Adineta vaga]|nr:hypothetical protein I4U23_008929 [Adineta vaga]